MSKAKSLIERRRQRVRTKLRKRAGDRGRLTVFRSSQHIYAQVIDDARGHTVAAASSIEKDMRGELKTGANVEAASKVGTLVAERARQAGVEDVIFDRGSYIFHGRVKAVADAARAAGLKF